MTFTRGCRELAGLQSRLLRLRRAADTGADRNEGWKVRKAQERIRDHVEDCQECLRLSREAPSR